VPAERRLPALRADHHPPPFGVGEAVVVGNGREVVLGNDVDVGGVGAETAALGKDFPSLSMYSTYEPAMPDMR